MGRSHERRVPGVAKLKDRENYEVACAQLGQDSAGRKIPRRVADLSVVNIPSTHTLKLLSFDGFALLAVFLQTSELYRPLGFIAGFPNSLSVNLVFLIFFSIYLIVRIRLLAELSSAIPIWWFGALVVVPFFVMGLQMLDQSVTFTRLVYWSAYSLLFALLLLVAMLLWLRWGANLSTPFFLAAIGAAWFGFIVNWVDYQFLRDVMVHGSNPIGISETTTRTIGFYQHPNAAAFSLVLYFACLACDKRFLTGSFILQVLASMGCVVGVLVTGSRTSLVLVVLVFATYLRNLARLNRGAHEATSRASARRRAQVAALIPLGVLAATLVLMQIIAASRQDLAALVSARIGSFTNLGADTSTDQRVTIISHYITDVMRSPILGHGPDFVSNQIALGSYTNVSQNSWLEWAATWGVPYALFMAVLLYVTYRMGTSYAGPQPLLLSFARLILVLFLLITFSMVNPFWMRSPVCVLGVLFGLLLYSGSDSNRQAITAISTRRNGTERRNSMQRSGNSRPSGSAD